MSHLGAVFGAPVIDAGHVRARFGKACLDYAQADSIIMCQKDDWLER